MKLVISFLLPKNLKRFGIFIGYLFIYLNCVQTEYTKHNNWIFFFSEYLSQFITVSNENKCKNLNVQLTVEDQLKRLNKGKNNTSYNFLLFVILHEIWHILGLQFVEQLICEQTYENHEELFSQVTWIENLESIINEIASQIQVN